jgi:hypothetical protein
VDSRVPVVVLVGMGVVCTWFAFNPRMAWRIRESSRYDHPDAVERSLRTSVDSFWYAVAALVAFGFAIFFLVADLGGLWDTECDEIMTALVESESAHDAADELGVELADRNSIVVHDVLQDGQRLGWVNLATEDYSCGG